MLRGVMDHGTGVRARIRYGLHAPLGCKTGTTQNHSDGWFMGFTPTLVSGVWVGGEERSIHFDRMAIGQGANMSLPIWAMFMQKVYADTTLSYNQSEKFSIPRWFKANEGCIQEDTPESGQSTAELVAEISE
jgi:penicillin-binding protein 1A